MSMLWRNMTCAPKANLASDPAVMLQASFSFASFSAVSFLSHLWDYMFH